MLETELKMRCRKFYLGLIFFIGWLLSPLTWWNDALINLPLSYFLANLLFYLTHLPFKWLVLGSYWASNILGLGMMFFGGKHLISSFRERVKAAIILVLGVIAVTVVTFYLERAGRLLPLGDLWRK